MLCSIFLHHILDSPKDKYAKGSTRYRVSKYCIQIQYTGTSHCKKLPHTLECRMCVCTCSSISHDKHLRFCCWNFGHPLRCVCVPFTGTSTGLALKSPTHLDRKRTKRGKKQELVCIYDFLFFIGYCILSFCVSSRRLQSRPTAFIQMLTDNQKSRVDYSAFRYSGHTGGKCWSNSET